MEKKEWKKCKNERRKSGKGKQEKLNPKKQNENKKINKRATEKEEK